MNRRTFLRTTGTATCLFGIPALSAEKRGATDAEILSQAKERIAKHRQSEGRIIVRGPDGKPLVGVAVKVEQLRHDFLFGCNFFMFARLRDSALEEAYRQRFAALFNYATLGFYWPMYEPERSQPNYDYTDKVVDWCGPHGIQCKGHPLVWDFADPKWLPREFAEIQTLSHQRVRDIVARFKGSIDRWDVVNEPTHLGRFKTRLGEWAISLGAVPYVTEHLKIARAANPTATLLVNDYRTDAPFQKILESLRENGQPRFDAVGIQSHMHDGCWPLRKVWDICDTYGQFGLPVHFTETTLVSGPRNGPGENWGPTNPELEEKQADGVARFYTTLFAHPATQALTWWDFSDAGAWQRAAAGLTRRDMSPKPAYERLLALIKKEWWTNLGGRTGAQGEFTGRAFHGTHRLTATLANGEKLTKEVHWERNQPNRFALVADA